MQTDRFIRRSDVAALLGTSESVAASVMTEHGVHPINLGAGRGRGWRYLESAVHDVLRQMHEAANPVPVTAPKMPRISGGILGRSVDDLYSALTPAHSLQ